MGLKDSWKEAGKGLGRSFAGAGKAILQSAKVGLDKVTDETPDDGQPTGLKESWSEVGHSFLKSGASLGRAAAETADRVIDELDPDSQKPGAVSEEDKWTGEN